MGDTALGMARPALSDAGTGPVSRHSRKPGRFIPSGPRRDRPGSLPRSSADQRERRGETTRKRGFGRCCEEYSLIHE